MEEFQQDLIKRLRRAEGQVRGVQRLVEEGADCEKVVQQLAAVRKALDKTFYKAVACAIQQALDADDAQAADIAHYTDLLARYG
jgi:DNA-binding FrmR family transcriptional regulator